MFRLVESRVDTNDGQPASRPASHPASRLDWVVDAVIRADLPRALRRSGKGERPSKGLALQPRGGARPPRGFKAVIS